MARSMAETVVVSVLHEYRRCLYCHRSAMIERRHPEEEQ
jgi:hypothetical protein